MVQHGPTDITHIMTVLELADILSKTNSDLAVSRVTFGKPTGRYDMFIMIREVDEE